MFSFKKNSDKIFSGNCALSFDDVLIEPKFSHIRTRASVDTSFILPGIHSYLYKNPIISANMDTITGEKMLYKMKELGGLGILHRNMSQEDLLDLLDNWFNRSENMPPIVLSVGSIYKDKARIDCIINYINEQLTGLCQDIVFCIDIANADSTNMINTIEYISSSVLHSTIIAGNVCTPEACNTLLSAGADIIKVGVGAGSVCLTREETGVGYPQLEAIYRCAKVAPIIADGGIRKPGDAVKALAAGAIAVMLGGQLAGTDCVPGWDDKATQVPFRGSASKEAQEATGSPVSGVEGVSVRVPTKGPNSTEDVVTRYIKGIQSACSYVGASNLAGLKKNAKFIRVSNSSIRENGAHI